MKIISRLLTFLALTSALPAAIAPTMVWNCRASATAGNLNGGGFKPGATGTDYSLQDAAQYNLTTATTAGADGIILDASAAAVMVGNVAHVISGTNFTPGWYEITSVSVGVSITVDRNCTTAAGAVGVINIGGAMSLVSTLDDDFFEVCVAGNTVNVKGASYTLGEIVTIAVAGGASSPIKIVGYTTTPGDACTGTQRPVFACGGNSLTFNGANWDVYNLNGTSTGTTGLTLGTGGKAKNCKWVNSSTGVDREAATGATDAIFLDCEFVSYRGNAIASSSGGQIVSCWLHDSNVGLDTTSATVPTIVQDCIIESCVTAAIRFPAATIGACMLRSNTLFGSANTTGIGISLATGVTDMRVINNIITGFVTGVVHADTQTVGYDNFNDYFNNDADVSAAGQWQKGPNDQAIAPSFTNVGQVTGATATTTAGNHLVQSGATFVTSGVTAGRDYVYIVSGTGVTAGIYGILTVDSETQITTDITLAAEATANKVFQITTGHNFAIGSALKALGAPAGFQGGYTTGYTDPGAVQRQEPAGGGQTSSGFVK